MQQRAEWLNARTQVIVGNIANADLRHARRQDLSPFEKILIHSRNARTNTGKLLKDVKEFEIRGEHIVSTNEEISREQEMMLLTRTTTEHEGLLSMIKKFHQMYRTILSKG